MIHEGLGEEMTENMTDTTTLALDAEIEILQWARKARSRAVDDKDRTQYILEFNNRKLELNYHSASDQT